MVKTKAATNESFMLFVVFFFGGGGFFGLFSWSASAGEMIGRDTIFDENF